MTIRDLKKLVRQGEGQFVEFKKKANHPEKIVKEVVAFANASGGKLMIGVDDFGALAGCKYPEEEAYVLEKAFKEMIYPTISMEKEEVKLDTGKTILIYHVPEGDRKPYRVKFEDNSKVYIRREDRSIQASAPVREIIRRRQNPKDIRFQVGEVEQKLLAYLEQHRYITVAQLSQMVKVNKKMAARKLIILVLANVLDIHPFEEEDRYFLKAQ
ncbi:helix-turn-helix domain-containing protein [Persicobacter sp. CCB-QB2]|uniref:AlbA family DNA-binding domain-containing protein n=1 Tax=Persicobacter sp. CCB-QB2 TaxID=1561025 RepID=UPI0006A94A8C|nr:ATP-binding protein [Persicobacter sp. CCB-QB2]